MNCLPVEFQSPIVSPDFRVAKNLMRMLFDAPYSPQTGTCRNVRPNVRLLLHPVNLAPLTQSQARATLRIDESGGGAPGVFPENINWWPSQAFMEKVMFFETSVNSSIKNIEEIFSTAKFLLYM